MEWISVDDRLPEIGSPVLCCWDDGVNLVSYRMEHGNFEPQWQYSMGRNWKRKITHWMPLPAAPATNNEKG